MFRLPVSLTSSSLRRPLKAAGAVAAACALALTVTACGGGSQAVRFKPSRVVSFGDDNSFVSGAAVAGPVSAQGVSASLAAGRKYTVNAVALDANGNARLAGGGDTDTTTEPSQMIYNCQVNAIWVQTVAAAYGFDAAQCPVSGATREAYLLALDPATTATDAAGALNATNAALAKTNAGVAKVVLAMQANVSLLNNGTLVLVMAGQPDVLDAYARYLDNRSALTNLKAEMKALGTSLAKAMTQYIKPTGARVALVRLPQLKLSPLGQAATADDQAALEQLVVAFNDGVTNQAEVDFDGRQITLVRTDTLTAQMFDGRTRGSYGISNSTDVGCASGRATSAPLCNTSYANGGVNSQGAVNSSVSSSYLWADATHFAPQAHTRLASLVISAINRNPL